MEHCFVLLCCPPGIASHDKTRATFSTNKKQSQNQSCLARTRFPALDAGYMTVFASSSDWFIALFTPVVIGQSNYFGFGFT